MNNQFYSKNWISDTIADTVKIAVSVNTKYNIRVYQSSPAVGHVQLFITARNYNRERLNLELIVPAKDWLPKRQRLAATSGKNRDLNLIIDNYDSKITEITTIYRLENKVLTPAILRDEILNGMTRINFIAFFRKALDEEKANLRRSTFRKSESIYNKLYDFKTEICFSELDLSFFNRYRTYLQESKSNGRATINTNIGVIKKYLRMAVKYGIKIKFDVDDIVGGSTAGNRTYLSAPEIQKLITLYTLNVLSPPLKLVLGYFLFATMTGLRIGDLMNINRRDLSERGITFVNTKSDKNQFIALNATAQNILKHCPELFVTKFSEKHLNKEIKRIILMCDITKPVCFHVARHTFAMCFLEAGGDVTKLQILLGHSKITTTMVYVHMKEVQANKQIFVLDELFSWIIEGFQFQSTLPISQD